MDLGWYQKQVDTIFASEDLVEVGQTAKAVLHRMSRDYEGLDELTDLVMAELLRRGLSPIKIASMLGPEGTSGASISRAKKRWDPILERLDQYPLPEPVEGMTPARLLAHVAAEYNKERSEDTSLPQKERDTARRRWRALRRLTPRRAMHGLFAIPFIPGILIVQVLAKKLSFGAGAAGGTAAATGAGATATIGVPAVAAGGTGIVGALSSGVTVVTGVVASAPQVMAGAALTVAAVAAPITVSQAAPEPPKVAYQIVEDTRDPRVLGPLAMSPSAALPTPSNELISPAATPTTLEPTPSATAAEAHATPVVAKTRPAAPTAPASTAPTKVASTVSESSVPSPAPSVVPTVAAPAGPTSVPSTSAPPTTESPVTPHPTATPSAPPTDVPTTLPPTADPTPTQDPSATPTVSPTDGTPEPSRSPVIPTPTVTTTESPEAERLSAKTQNVWDLVAAFTFW